MWKVVRRGLVAHKLRFALTSLAVVIAVAFMAGTAVFSATLQQTFDDLFADIYRDTDAVVRSPEALESDFGAGLRPPVPEELVRTVREAPGVASAAGTVQVDYAQVVDKSGDPIGNPGSGAPAFGMGWVTDEALNRFTLVDGAAPETADQVVIDKNTADKGDLKVGDTVRILTIAEPRDYQLVGIARFGTANSLAGASISLFTMRQAQELSNKVGKFDEIHVAADQGVSQQQVTDNVRVTLQQAGVRDVEVVTGEEITKENQDALKEQLSFFPIILNAFAFIALFVAVFIIYNTFSITVAQRTREMALLRAVGASRRQVFSQVVGEAVVIGVVASLIGAACGLLIAMALKAMFEAFGLDFPANALTIPVVGVTQAIVIGIFVTVLFAVFPARRGSRVPPVAAMRDVALEAPIKRGLRFGIGGGLLAIALASLLYGAFGGGGFLFVIASMVLMFFVVFALGPLFARGVARFLGAPLPKIKGMTGTLARENATRNPRRTNTTALALVVGVTFVGFITIFAASAKASIASALDDNTQVDYFITSGTGFGGTGLSPELGKEVATLPEIEAVTPLRFNPMTPNVGIGGTNEPMVGVNPVGANAMLKFGDVAGTWLDLKPGGIAVSKDKADDDGYKIGDTIPVKFVDTGVQPLRVDYIFDENFFSDFFISDETFDANYNQPLDFQVFAKLKPGVTPEQGRAALEPVVDKFPTAKLRDNAQYKKDQAASINQIVGVVYGMLFLTIFIALIGIIITLFLSIYERTRELGLLRAVGMSRGQVRSAIRWESVIIAVFGSVLGLGIGLFYGYSVFLALRDEGFSTFAAAPSQLLIIVIIAALLGVGAAILPARRASRLDVLKAIETH